MSESGAAYDGYEGSAGCSPPLSKIIPLILFGPRVSTFSGGLPLSPSFIGVDCGDGSYGTPLGARLAVNLQTSRSFTFSETPFSPENNLRSACFYMNGYFPGSANIPSQFLTVTPDVWHHVLISFDLSPSCSITYGNIFNDPFAPDLFQYSLGPTFSWAFDDVAKVGSSMLPSGSGGNRWGLDTVATDSGNQHILPNGFFSVPVGQDYDDFPVEDRTNFTVSLAGGSIAAGALGIPSAADFEDNAYNVKMAYLQVFTGVTANATTEEVRRAFVKSDGTPETDFSIAAALLGKSPDIKFKNGKDFRNGRNTGTGGAFSKTGTINAATPGPDLTP